MEVTIRYANQPDEMDEIFRLRHDVFVTEGQYMPARPDSRIYDRFDALATSRHIAAFCDNCIIGSTRLTQNSTAGASSDEFFNFKDYLPADRRLSGASSMTCVRREYQRSRLGFYLFCFAWETARRVGWASIYGVINPEIKTWVLKMGFRQLDQEAFDTVTGLNFIPLVLEMRDLSEDYLRVMGTIPDSEWTVQVALQGQKVLQRVT
jgi:N-acyl-L-homoserine lactone synthetase